MNPSDAKFLRHANTPLLVALVTETFPPEINGVAMTLGRMVAALRERGHRVQLVRPRQNSQETPLDAPDLRETLTCGCPIPRYPDLRFGLPASSELTRLWREDAPDIVHIATQGPLGWSAASTARRLGLPVSSSFHTNFDAYSRHYGIGWLQAAISAYLRRFHNRTDATLVPTHGLAKILTAEGYRNVSVVSRGVDTALFNPGRRSQSLRDTWGAGADDLVVTHVGRLAPEKNLALVLQAFAAIKRSRPDARLAFVGDGPQRAALSAKHPDFIFAGMRRGEDLATHYASADIFLFPSLTETFGNVTAEALASGLGVIGFDYAAAAELIDDGHNGFIAPPGDSTAFTRSAVQLAINPALLAHVRGRAAASVARLDWSLVHETLVATLRQVIATHRRKRRAEDALVVAAD